jgi:hypothetical protein
MWLGTRCVHDTAPATAAARAAWLVERVSDSPHGRMRLCAQTYENGKRRNLPFRRAALSFMRWQVGRGLLAGLDAQVPGSRWWRAVNARLLQDGCEAVSLGRELPGEPSSPTVELWLAFLSRPTARAWYRAHNASIVAAYLAHADLAEREAAAERFFMNVVLMRVLYAHALVAAPRLALGRLAPIARPLGDPRLGMAGVFLSLSRILPARYPAVDDVLTYVHAENDFGRMLDYGVILPRLQPLYRWSADELGEPALCRLVSEGRPSYVAPTEADGVWRPAATPGAVSLLRKVTSA